jgi:hypothetical protein
MPFSEQYSDPAGPPSGELNSSLDSSDLNFEIKNEFSEYDALLQKIKVAKILVNSILNDLPNPNSGQEK